jgi:hypothetical protein
MTRRTRLTSGRWASTMPWALGLAAIALLGASALAAYIDEPGNQPDPRVEPTPIVRPIPRPLPPPVGQVPELERYLDRLEIGRPLVYGRLAVFPVTARGGGPLGGNWLTMDQAFSRGVLSVTEKGGGTVPAIWMENRSERDSILIVAGEVVAGGKQTRTIRQDVVLAPGRKVDVSVFCVEAHRWEGQAEFRPSPAMAPQSVQRDMKAGADQAQVWSGVARTNEAAGAKSATGNLEAGYAEPAIRRELDASRRAIVPEVGASTVGFIFVERFGGNVRYDGPVAKDGDNPSATDPRGSTERSRTAPPVWVGGRALGAEFFGSPELARAMLPKLIDAYAIEVVKGDRPGGGGGVDESVARDFLSRIRGAESFRADTPGSGSGIRLRGSGLVGEGVSLDGELVHFGAQPTGRVDPPPPMRPMPRPTPIQRPMPLD